MSLELFTTQQGFTTNLNDLSSKIGVNNNVAAKKNTLEPFKSIKSATQNAEDKKQFADFMDSLKKKQNAEQNRSASQKTENTEKEDTSISLAQFQTQQSAASISEFTGKYNEITPASLTLLSEKLQMLIDEQTGQTDIADTGLIQVLDSGTDDTEALRALLATIITKIQGNDRQSGEVIEQSDFTVTQGSDSLITLLGGLSPQEITDLKAQINNFLTRELSDEDENALAALINQFYPLTQPDNKVDKSQVTTASTISDNVLKTDLQANPNNTGQQQKQPTQGRYDARYDGRYDGMPQAQEDSSDKIFESALKNIDGKNIGNTSPTIQSGQTAGQKFLQTNAAISSTMGGLDGALPQNGLSIASQAPTAIQSALTNITTQAPSAGANHPATQLVSMTIQKAFKAGDDTNIKLRLDPPELGRVEVKMSIDKDSTTKIVLTAEKPETYLMLQRDSQILHQALSDSGLDNGADLSFEMADDNHDFNQQNSNSGSGSGKGSGNEDEQITQSTMDWHVDPDTGRMHYNILV